MLAANGFFADLLSVPVLIALALLVLIVVLCFVMVGRSDDPPRRADPTRLRYLRGLRPPERTEEEEARRLAALRLVDPELAKLLDAQEASRDAEREDDREAENREAETRDESSLSG